MKSTKLSTESHKGNINVKSINTVVDKLWLSKATLDLSALSKIIGKFWSNMVNFNYSSGRSAGRPAGSMLIIMPLPGPSLSS